MMEWRFPFWNKSLSPPAGAMPGQVADIIIIPPLAPPLGTADAFSPGQLRGEK
jgi:hypothetical protein